MNAARRTTKMIMRNAGGRWRGPLAFCLALAVAISLFHDLPALAGTAGSGPIPVAVVSSGSPLIQAPESQAPGLGCHCLCHMAAQATTSSVVTSVVFKNSLEAPPASTPPRSCAGLPPFRPPRV